MASEHVPTEAIDTKNETESTPATLPGGSAALHEHTPSDIAAGRIGSTDTIAMQSPRILSVSWGQIDVESMGNFKDVKLWPGGGRAWDWSETGTRHSPGIQLADAEELLQHGATVLVLSRGMQERLKVSESTVEALRARGIEVHVAETRAAVEIYNNLVLSMAVAGLFHSTC